MDLDAATRRAIIAKADSMRGLPYRIHPPPDGVNNVDCSLFVLLACRAAGIAYPSWVRTAEQIRGASLPIKDWAAVKAGDLLFFEGTYDAAGPAGADGRIASHVGISLGAGTKLMWDANDARGGVGVTNVGTTYWQSRLLSAGRPPIPDRVPVAPPPVPSSPALVVGAGILGWMQRDGDTAARDSSFLGPAGKTRIEVGYGESGALYVWDLVTGTRLKLPPT